MKVVRNVRGRISEIDNLATMDLVAFNGGVNPFGNEFIRGGFGAGAAHYREVVKKWGFVGHGRVADLGSGYGRWSVFLAEENDCVWAFERNEAANELARKLASLFALENVQFEASDITALPRDAASFDAVWCYNTLQFVDRAKALQEMHRVLRPGGLLHIGGYNGAGNMLARFFNGFKTGGIASHAVKFGLRSLAQGPLYDGQGSYGSVDHMRTVLSRFGFTLCESPPIEADPAKPMPTSGAFSELLRDLPALASRLLSDPSFAAEFAAHPEFAQTYPVNVNLVATRD
jgi:SAM-dependent methyltransferase